MYWICLLILFIKAETSSVSLHGRAWKTSLLLALFWLYIVVCVYVCLFVRPQRLSPASLWMQIKPVAAKVSACGQSDLHQGQNAVTLLSVPLLRTTSALTLHRGTAIDLISFLPFSPTRKKWLTFDNVKSTAASVPRLHRVSTATSLLSPSPLFSVIINFPPYRQRSVHTTVCRIVFVL